MDYEAGRKETELFTFQSTVSKKGLFPYRSPVLALCRKSELRRNWNGLDSELKQLASLSKTSTLQNFQELGRFAKPARLFTKTKASQGTLVTRGA